MFSHFKLSLLIVIKLATMWRNFNQVQMGMPVNAEGENELEKCNK